ncbi:transposase, partial [Ligilactobacillus murinus]|uniref:transposase n=1 Tax=Ligilactobacillus murinus TaxID=1622 RepID=UPI001CDAECA6
MKQLHKNIKIFYLATTLTTLAASLPHAVLTVLLFAKGLSLTQIMLVQATYSLVILVSEYPSGLLADLYSKKVLFLWAAIMPSKYTDEIENSSYTWRVFYMSRKSKYSAEQKLAILNELTRSNISEVAKKYAVGKKTIRTWGYLYEYQGIDGLRSTHNNH